MCYIQYDLTLCLNESQMQENWLRDTNQQEKVNERGNPGSAMILPPQQQSTYQDFFYFEYFVIEKEQDTLGFHCLTLSLLDFKMRVDIISWSNVRVWVERISPKWSLRAEWCCRISLHLGRQNTENSHA